MSRLVNGVLLINFGAPKNLEDVESFVSSILNGRKLPPPALEKIKERYRLIGGGSPLPGITRLQAELLEQELNREKDCFKVFAGMLHSPPYIPDVIRQMVEEKISRIVVLSLAPFYSRVSTGRYYAAVKEAGEQYSISKLLHYAGSWHTHPLFLAAQEQRIKSELAKIGQQEKGCLVFTAHSLPAGDDAVLYQEQYRQAVQGVSLRFPGYKIRIAYQSRGMGKGTWLAPAVEDILTDLAGEGEKDVLVVPIGFVSDHVETLYDLDIILKEHAESFNLKFQRCPALNDSNLFIKALASVVHQLGDGMIL
ncbi:MAG: ferrochelatase [Desulfitobacteriaceae bacterium]|nr:ferrochelatase [Desulfitobacteriaceae bacterium]